MADSKWPLQNMQGAHSRRWVRVGMGVNADCGRGLLAWTFHACVVFLIMLHRAHDFELLTTLYMYGHVPCVRTYELAILWFGKGVDVRTTLCMCEHVYARTDVRTYTLL